METLAAAPARLSAYKGVQANCSMPTSRACPPAYREPQLDSPCLTLGVVLSSAYSTLSAAMSSITCFMCGKRSYRCGMFTVRASVTCFQVECGQRSNGCSAVPLWSP